MATDTRASINVVIGEEAIEQEKALRNVQSAIDTLEDVRSNLAHTYIAAEGGSIVEHEVGECLTQVRKALARLRKARGELAQEALPL